MYKSIPGMSDLHELQGTIEDVICTEEDDCSYEESDRWLLMGELGDVEL